MREDDDYPITFDHLYYKERVDVDVLVKAVETVGVWGYHRGTFRHFKPGSLFCRQAVERLAHQVAIGDELPDGMEPDYENDCFYHFGWPRNQLPDFEKIAKGSWKRGRPSDATKVESGHLLSLEGLLEFMEGKAPDWERHPSFKSRADLIARLAHYMKGYQSQSKRELEDRFRDARAVMELADRK